jgi:hypothetical protein
MFIYEERKSRISNDDVMWVKYKKIYDENEK